jgi:hypothetical protein
MRAVVADSGASANEEGTFMVNKALNFMVNARLKFVANNALTAGTTRIDPGKSAA